MDREPIPQNETLVPTSCCIGGAVANCTGEINKGNIDTGKWDAVIYTEVRVFRTVVLKRGLQHNQGRINYMNRLPTILGMLA